MSILLAGMVVFISVMGPAGMAVAVGLRCPCPNLVQIRMPMPKSQRSAPPTPTPHPATQWEGCKGVGKGSGIVFIAGAASPGAYQPLTDLGKCSSGERAQGTPHSCAALAPVLGEMHRSTW